MLPERVILCDIYGPVVEAWREYFASVPSVEIPHQDVFSVHADALVSPANSFGGMGGGLDEKIVDFLGLDTVNPYLAMRAAYDHVVSGKRPNLDLSLDAAIDSRDRLEVILEEAAFAP